ncbi:MAG: DUF885 domain-containing protein, partial [Gammaproteobacteria bacterium]|nr:DUF885 domain-containing protein [Gammaproteobacteria bacterium]
VEDREMLHRYDRSKLEGQAAISYDVMDWLMTDQTEGVEFTWHGYPVNQLFGVQNRMPNFMATIHHVGNERDARHYNTRLSKFDTKFDQLLEDLNLREEKGIIPPTFVVEKVIVEMNDFRNTPAKENILYTSFAEKLDKLEDLDEATRAELLARSETEINGTVYPAYDGLISYFEKLRPKATTNHGAWKLPNGDAFYDYRLRSSTSTDMTADEIHDLGLAEVARIQTQMDEILSAEGYSEGTVAERMAILNKEERFLYTNDDEGREQILKDFQGIIDEISEKMPEYFVTLPESKVQVKRIPEFSQANSAGAYYQGPSMDGSRPGVFYANLRNLEEHPKYGMRTLAYHEAMPGHHLQTALQIEMTGVPQFRKMMGFTAFSEGWALYSERVAWEAGFQDDPYDNLGRLQAELFRGVRLVVDTGIHRKRWSREKAIDYMYGNTGMAKHEVVSEIERYFVIPGQATAYKVGMLKILELRERAITALGEEFDIREFHDVVLRNGDIPLTVLEQQVDQYIAGNQAG